ncbi:type II toxin-antitoxin system RelE family toxin [Levilactobacillus angrenensis]|uniref:Type II toxin-antitoxin system RelE/ParE family toxin n=1 Tax=Levilactobacillus angrenensis TaxID=2486020 RepID=A0ABW1U8V5_9LACO|nr:type II toxin-antitoxin system RelE/ParE family toxin [Levilactobacillus angrenensis]
MANYSGYWRYRVGNYRLIAVIKEHEVVIEIIAVGHRRMIHQPKK